MLNAKIIPLLLAPILLASSAMSQTAGWDAVQFLPSGTKIKVTLKRGSTFGHCFLNGVSDDQLDCSSGRGPLSRRKVYLRDDIKAVYLTHNGPAIGIAVGAGAGAVIGAATPGCCRAAMAFIDAGLLSIPGWFFGSVLDPFFHGRAVYRSPQDPYHAPFQDRNNPSLPNVKNASQPSRNVPSCLRDGKTMQCVQ
jgi:hypothetical protein